MSSLVPVKEQRRWIATEDGMVTPYVPRPIAVLNSVQQHTAMRHALAHLLRILTEHGFETNCIEQSSCAVSLSFKEIHFDVSIREPARIAYITSRKGSDNGERFKIGEDRFGNPIFNTVADIKFASESFQSSYVLQFISSKISSAAPIYIECPAGEPNPVGYMLKNLLMLISSVVSDEVKVSTEEINNYAGSLGIVDV